MSQPPFTGQQRELLRELLRAGAVLIGDAVRERFGAPYLPNIEFHRRATKRPSANASLCVCCMILV